MDGDGVRLLLASMVIDRGLPGIEVDELHYLRQRLALGPPRLR